VILLKNFLNIFRVPELRKKVLFTLGVLIVFQLGHHIPVIGIDIDKLRQLMSGEGLVKGIFSYLDMFSGGGLSNGVLFALGINPYITASIMMQFLALSIPSLEQLLKEGEYGRKLVNQYTRYLALGVAVAQAMGYATLIQRLDLAVDPNWAFYFIFILSLVVGSVFVMWLGEQISLFGIGNGSSVLIFANIVARFPNDVIKVIGNALNNVISWPTAIIIFACVIFVTACVVFLERGERKIAVQYARRVVGHRMYGGQSVYIPFKINASGVMPVILAGAALNVPMLILPVLASKFGIGMWLAESLARGGLLYNVLEFFMIIAFSFFYMTIQFNPEELADNIKKSGGFIPGIRPGRKTAEFFNYLLMRIGLVGAIYLGLLAIFPAIIHALLDLKFYVTIMNGTSMLIMVGVALEMAAQIESYLIEHRYEGFLSSGRIHSRSSR